MPSEIIPSDFPAWLETLKRQITASRSRAALAVNAELIHLYHRIGREILDRQTHHGWGSKVITRIADDLKAAFPDINGFSPRNVKYMRYFAEHCPDGQFGQQSAAQLPWFHIVTIGLLLCKGKDKLVVEYALRGLDQSIAIAIANWQTQLTETLPQELKGSLPTIAEIEAELARDIPSGHEKDKAEL